MSADSTRATIRGRLLAASAVVWALIAASLAVALTAVVAVWMAGPSGYGSSPPGPDDGNWTVEDARSFTGFELYWLGEEFMGHELKAIVREDFVLPSGAVTDSVSFIYGDCELTRTTEPTCTPPISVRVDAICTRPPALFSGVPRTARGATVVSTSNSSVSLWTGDAHAEIQSGPDGPGSETALAALEAVSLVGARAGENLIPPDLSAC